MSETIRERVVRLIAEMRNRTTDRGATPAEAAGFAAKVAEWIEKYQIEEEELRYSGGDHNTTGPDIEVCENYLRTDKKVFNPGMTQVVNALSEGMCCKCILLNKDRPESGNEAVYGIIGDVLDADYVCQVATCVVPALQMMATLEGREHGYEKAGLIRWSNQYLTGAATEILKRLEDERKRRSELKQAEEHIKACLAGTQSQALVVVTGESLATIKRAAVAESFRGKYPKTRTQYSRTEYNHEAHSAGREAGKRVGLHPGLGK